MKLTKTKLKRLIKEELQKALEEQKYTATPMGATKEFSPTGLKAACTPDRKAHIATMWANMDKKMAAAKEKGPQELQKWIVWANKRLGWTFLEWLEQVRAANVSAKHIPSYARLFAERQHLAWRMLRKYTNQKLGPDPCTQPRQTLGPTKQPFRRPGWKKSQKPAATSAAEMKQWKQKAEQSFQTTGKFPGEN